MDTQQLVLDAPTRNTVAQKSRKKIPQWTHYLCQNYDYL